MSESILVLGGYGTTGRTLCELLLEHGDGDVVVAGRSLEKGEAAAVALGARFPGRVTARAADAADAASLARALDGVGLVAVAASVLAHAGTVAQAALDAGIDYFDLLLTSEEKFAALERLRPRLETSGRCFITDGGIHPGLSAVLIRALAPAFSRLERADVAGLLKVDWASYDFQPATIHEFANEFRDYRMETLRDGVWQRIEWRGAMRSVDFGPPWGGQRCSLMYMKELELLPEHLPDLRTCGFYVSGFNPVVDTTVLPLGMAVMKYSPDALGKPYSRLLAWSLRRFSKPPYGTVFQVEAEGEAQAGRALQAGLRVTHPDGYWLTSAAGAACLLQWQDGSLREPGLHLQALAADPARLLRDLQTMGAGLEGRGVDIGALLAAHAPDA
jgi:saccharopine dehydrogenase (NAD+, L-lysine-forming)